MKFFDTVKAATAAATTGTISNLSLNLIPQGVTESQRIGRKCTIKSLHIRGEYTLPTTSTPASTTDRVRTIIYLDKQTNGVTATVTGILESAAINSFNNLANQSRFTILSDKTFSMNMTAGAYDGTNDQFGKISRPFMYNKKCNIPIEFDSTTGAITEIRSNNLGLLTISQVGDVLLAYTARVRYSDN